MLTCFLFLAQDHLAQDRVVILPPDTAIFFNSMSLTYFPQESTVERYPSGHDSVIYEKHKELISKKPTPQNYHEYSMLANSLWDLGMLNEAEQMLLEIVGTKDRFYSSTYYHSSDVPGDTAGNVYGYGSFTSSYKNSACLTLTKVYIEKKEFKKALHYLGLADKKYQVSYSCGTGHRMYSERLRDLYAQCYGALKMDKEAIDLLLPFCFERRSPTLINALERTYTKEQIASYIAAAESSITCKVDAFPSHSETIHNYGEKDEYTTHAKYFSGTGTITLFDRVIVLPYPDLKDGETVTREHFVRCFKASDIYKTLADNIQ